MIVPKLIFLWFYLLSTIESSDHFVVGRIRIKEC